MRVVSYNLLADTYIRPEWYPGIPNELLDWSLRKERLLQHLLSLNADILCLQEVESHAYDELYPDLKHSGFYGIFGRKGFGRQDGCATFFRKRMDFLGANTVIFNDRGKTGRPSGHVALILKLQWNHHVLGVVNTHIRWNPPEKPLEEHRGYQQVKELVDHHLSDNEVEDWILCGDFNADADTPVIQLIRDAGFKDAYENLTLPTMNKDGLARIDYIFYSKGLKAEPELIEELTERSILPSLVQPSDHLAISAVINKI